MVGYLVADGRADEAVKAAEAALAAHPDSALFHELRGRALWSAGDAAAGRKAIERALELEPERATALGGLAALTAEQGDRAAGITDRGLRITQRESALPHAIQS